MEGSSTSEIDMGARGSRLFPRTFSPLTVRGLTFRNRLFLTPMGLDLANRDGTLSSELLTFYSDIARGGVGFFVLGNATVSRDSILQPKALMMTRQEHAETLVALQYVARAGASEVCVQLQHYGAQGTTTFTRGRALLSPSGVPSQTIRKLDPKYRLREMTVDDIRQVVDDFANAARSCAVAGFSFIQIQASNGYLLSSFLSKYTNRRTDEYGGDPVRRARLLVEILRAVRASVGSDVVVSLRIGIDDFLGEAGQTPEDLADVAPLLEEAGADMFEASFCVADTFGKMGDRSERMRADLHAKIALFRSFCSVPVGFSGFVSGVDEAEALLAEGVADLIGMGRALLADNELIIKTLEGRTDAIDRCLWDGKCFKDKYNPRYDRVYCCVNPKYRRPD